MAIPRTIRLAPVWSPMIEGSISFHVLDRLTFTTGRFLRIVTAILDPRLFRVGDLFVRQVSGIPIGGPYEHYFTRGSFLLFRTHLRFRLLAGLC